MSPPDPPDAPLDLVCDPDGAQAAREAILRAADHRTAVWVGPSTSPELEDFRAEIGHAGA